MSRRRSLRNQSQALETSSPSLVNSNFAVPTPMSSTSMRPYSSSLSQSLAERFSHDEILRLLVHDVDQLARDFTYLAAECSVVEDNSQLAGNSTTVNTTQEYSDILRKKGNFINKLGSAIENFQDNSIGMLKYSNLGLVELLDQFRQRFQETKQNVARDKEVLKKQKNESAELSSQINIFSILVEDVEDGNHNEEFTQVRQMFQDVKADLDVVLNLTFPKAADKKKFGQAMSMLIEQYVENLDSKEDQYVQIVPDILKNTGLLRMLIEACVITPHPNDPKKLRLSIG